MTKILLIFFLILTNLFSKTDIETSISAAVSIQNAFNEVFRKTADSVVSISTEKTVEFNPSPFNHPLFRAPNGGQFKSEKQKQKGIGSGIILSKEGYIITNEHVIQGVDKVLVKLRNKKVYEAEVVGSDKQMDISLLKVKGTNDLQAIEIADSSKVNVGDWSIAIGAPMGFEHSFTVGVVSAISRGGIDDSGVGFIQTDASINQGNSGGPLLDIYGRVIGINRMIASPTGGSIGIGFAIPINDVKRIIDELKLNGKIKRPWVGVKISSIDEKTKDELKLPSTEGALIHQIYSDSPAEEAGLELMDFVIKIEDIKIKSSEELVAYVRKSKIGDRLSFVVIRKGKELKLSVKIREMPNG